jgi:holo-[acyl-carrier protein] synthase
MIALGVDAVEILRVQELLARHPGVKRKVFTPDEIAYCERSRRAGQHFAARFCAKEATFKALDGQWMRGEVGWSEVEVVRAPSGQPSLRLTGATLERLRTRGFDECTLTLSHTREFALAVVCLGSTAPEPVPS